MEGSKSYCRRHLLQVHFFMFKFYSSVGYTHVTCRSSVVETASLWFKPLEQCVSPVQQPVSRLQLLTLCLLNSLSSCSQLLLLFQFLQVAIFLFLHYQICHHHIQLQFQQLNLQLRCQQHKYPLQSILQHSSQQQ